jgi:hypothetical protein
LSSSVLKSTRGQVAIEIDAYCGFNPALNCYFGNAVNHPSTLTTGESIIKEYLIDMRVCLIEII